MKMKWNDYMHNTATAIQKGGETALHGLEGILATYGTLQAGYQLATQLGGGIRALGAIGPAAAGVALL